MPTAPQVDPPPPAAAGGGAAPAASTTTTNVSSSTQQPQQDQGGGAAAGNPATQQPLASTLPPLPPPVGGAGAGGTELDQTLASHYVGTFRMRLNQMSLASLARPINQNGKRVVMESIRKEGYSLATRKPSVLVPRVVIEGQELTPEFVGTLNVRVLDGNHRISCLMELHEPGFAIDVLVYRDFEDSQTESVVASGLNSFCQALAPTTTFDNLYQIKVLMDSIKAEKDYTRLQNVTANDLDRAFKKGGIKSKTSVQLCAWKKACLGFSADGFRTLRELFESDGSDGVDPKSLSLNAVNSQQVAMLKDTPLTQSLFLHIYARYNKVEKTRPDKKLAPAIVKQARSAASLIEQLGNVVPREMWNATLTKDVNKLTRGECNSDFFRNWVGSHQHERSEEVNDFQKAVDGRLSPHQEEIVMAKPMPRFVKIIQKDATLLSHYQTWLTKYDDVCKFVSQQKDISETSSSDSDDGNEASKTSKGKDSGSGDKVLRGTCEPNPESRYFCPNCNLVHRYDCDVCEEPDDDVPLSDAKYRSRLQCPGDAGAGKRTADVDLSSTPKKQKGKGKSLSVGDQDDTGVETSQSRNVWIHDKVLFVGSRTRKFDLGETLDTSKQPKLIVVDITSEMWLLQDNDSSRAQLSKFLGALIATLHDLGTIAIGVPRPWMAHGGRLYAILQSLGDLVVVEDSPILVSYESVAGGNVKKDRQKHMRNHTEAVLLVHKAQTAFTCNERVVPDDIHGVRKGALPKAKQTLNLKSLPNGAPGGGPRVVFPPQLCALLIGRFTMPGEHALGIGMGSTDFVRMAIERGRSVETYPTRNIDGEQEALRRLSDSAFRQAFNKGMFRFRVGSEVLVGPTILPSGVPANNIPPMVVAFLNDAPPADPDAAQPREFGVAQTVAKKAEYELKDTETGVQLARKKPSSRKSRSVTPFDLPLFGDFVVHDSVEQAVDSVAEDDVANQCVRLVLIADTRQLRSMLETGTELCKPKAALYLRVSMMCPLYWVNWEDDKETADLDLVSDIPQFGTRDTFLGKLRADKEGIGGVRARLMRNEAAFNRQLLLNPGRRVVGASCFGSAEEVVVEEEDGEGDGEGVTLRGELTKKVFGEGSAGAVVKLELARGRRGLGARSDLPWVRRPAAADSRFSAWNDAIPALLCSIAKTEH